MEYMAYFVIRIFTVKIFDSSTVCGFLLRAGHQQFFYKNRRSANTCTAGNCSELVLKICEKHL